MPPANLKAGSAMLADWPLSRAWRKALMQALDARRQVVNGSARIDSRI
jgi:hypothetical protein